MPYNNTPIAPSKEVTGHVSLPLARVQKIITSDPERLTVTKNASFAIALATEMLIQHLAITTHNVVKAERKPRRNIQYRDVSGAVSKTDNLEFLVDVVPKTVAFGQWKKRKAAEEKEGKEGEGEGKGEAGKEGGEASGKKVKARTEKSTAAAAAQRPLDFHQAAHTLRTAEGLPAGAPAPAPSMQADGGGVLLDPLSRTELVPAVPETEADAMEVDEEEAVAAGASDTEDDPAAMQLEMEMRGPPRGDGQAGDKAEGVRVLQEPPRVVSSGGFTAINGR
ncbi:hypothetical protein B5807_09280 [Epicoccum nigrum]|uniref:Transcription factor CBF/NF-Y/archaeal histone domain-containing protein n=1 Tax=Epicoccum nigrum TaxID=105696 RepID=A0A1Y2LMW7_EPING|nr:hypothetical protein B5807_09280 [Epicoccum nigrum]